MKILIINQHTSNHGDEAAGKALIRGIREAGIEDEIAVLYNVRELLEIEKFTIDKETKHLCSGRATFIDKVLLILTFIFPFFIVKRLYKLGQFIKYEYNLINEYDKVINGPGGVNIGPYKDWLYIWRLFVSLKLGKKVAIYSISFGPIPDTFLFKIVSKYILRNVDFLSLRDSKSQRYADELSLNYISSIDTAFLNNQPDTKIPIEIESQLKDDYVVVVPNQLYKWHPNYRNIKEDILDSLFLKVIGYFTKKKLKVVLLPQLFGLQNDSEYFNHLKNQSEKQDFIIIVDDNYSSDIQQKIIRQAKFLVGARYHTIIFSVNNRRPFLSLAYEHKMTNTLELIDLSENNIYIKKILNNELDIKEILEKKYNDGQNSIEEINKSSDIAQNISKDTLKYLVDNFLMSENKSKI